MKEFTVGYRGEALTLNELNERLKEIEEEFNDLVHKIAEYEILASNAKERVKELYKMHEDLKSYRVLFDNLDNFVIQ